jgi:hypothetical protein
MQNDEAHRPNDENSLTTSFVSRASSLVFASNPHAPREGIADITFLTRSARSTVSLSGRDGVVRRPGAQS